MTYDKSIKKGENENGDEMIGSEKWLGKMT
jgi:hypothetical protein